MVAPIATLRRYWHTVRYLRPVQIYGRLWFRFRTPRVDTRPAPTLRVISGDWRIPAARDPSLTNCGQFVFLGEAGSLRAVGWHGPLKEKLWRYNQHYFDDLNAKNAEARRHFHEHLLHEWVHGNPPGAHDGWEPYPTSLRIVNWIKWSLSGHKLSPECLDSLATQTRWLSRRLEVHLQGNHLLANAKALVFAGLFFAGPEADAWVALGLRILVEQLAEQILPDGGHFERSTMYHVLALEDVLDLCNVASTFQNASPRVTGQVDSWRAIAGKMLDWLETMCHPDGEISFFNDAAFGIAPSVKEVAAYAERLGIITLISRSQSVEQSVSNTHLTTSGYLRLVAGPAVAILDVAPIGPDYLLGHAHADTLTFELSIYGHRVVVNSGTSCYGSSTERLRQRGTAAHNTVTIAGANSSEVWGGFRVARRARTLGFAIDSGGQGDDDFITVRCSHDGYRRRPDPRMHERNWALTRHNFVIEDFVSRGARIDNDARFHFHPGVQVLVGESSKSGELLLPHGEVVRWYVENGCASLEASTWHPHFGHSVENVCLVVRLQENRSRVEFNWQPTVHHA